MGKIVFLKELFKKLTQQYNYVVLLDIDGVFNSFDYQQDSFEHIKHPWGTWHVKPENLEFLKQLSNYNCQWISTWAEESNYMNKYVEIPKFKNQFLKSKPDAVDRLLKKYSNILIVDDVFEDNRVDVLKVNPNIGLTNSDREYILQWIYDKERN